MVWFETTSIWSYCENIIKIQLVLAVLEKIYNWFIFVRYGLVWFETTFIWSYCENFIKIWLVLTVLENIYSWFNFVRFGMVWYGLVWSGLVWDIIHPKLLWLFHQNPTCFACFREDWKLWVGWGGKQQSSLALKGAEQFLSTPFYVHGFFFEFWKYETLQ